MKISTRLRNLRNEKGLTLREVGAIAEVPTSTYRDWEYGKAITGEPYAKLAEYYGVSLSYLILGTEKQPLEIVELILEAKRCLELAVKIARAL